MGAVFGADAFFAGATLGLLTSLAVIFLGIDVGALHPNAGLFYNKNTLGEAAAIISVWAITHAKGNVGPDSLKQTGPLRGATQNDNAQAYWYAIPSLFAVGLSTSRAAIVAVVAVVAWRLRSWFVLPFVAFVICVTLWLLLPWSSDSVQARLEAWNTLTATLTIYGHGLGSIPEALPVIRHAHNDVLELFYQLGILSIPLFVLFSVGLSTPNSDALWAFAILALVGFPLQNPLSAALGAVMLGDRLSARLSLRQPDYLGRTANDPEFPASLTA